ncbi:unnamed protein product [Tetraodon nigroviridis]|uniref:(spotted green pufferfish) hypothetical protein n=1 Tax=Tetraodon nigroviridis TaxID=99883 RepID=Q4SI83_TETNG|nr:unnamed protein product [Tetraodon nigroviridis]
MTGLASQENRQRESGCQKDRHQREFGTAVGLSPALTGEAPSESERSSLLEPRTDRPGKDSSFLRTMVLDKEEGEYPTRPCV